MALGVMGPSVGSLSGLFLQSDEEEGFIIKVDKQLICPSSSSSSSFSSSSSLSLSTSSASLSSSASWVYLKEYLGWVQDDCPRPNWILTEDTILEGERSEEGREEDLCRGIPPRPRPRPRPRWSTCCPVRLSWFCLARFRALRTGEGGPGGESEQESSKNACSSWASGPTSSVGCSVSAEVSVWF